MVSTTSVTQDAGAYVQARKLAEKEKADLLGAMMADAAEASETAARTSEEGGGSEKEAGPVRKLYFVRMPRPPMDNSNDKIQKLVDDFQAKVTKLKSVNSKVQAKRDEMRALRNQMSEARALRGENQPEYEEKLGRIKQLQDMKKGYLAKMGETKDTLKGLECKSEAELDAKIKEIEDRISHEANLELKEEKALVKHISTLNAQREAVKACDSQKASLAEMEAECSKIKAVISEMDGEFSVLKGERESAQKIMSSIYDKLSEKEKEMKELDEEMAEAKKAKDTALEKLDKARDAMNSGMGPYRDNRTFSMKVRDMVDAGKVEEAFAMCEAQMDAQLAELASNDAAHKNYTKLWSEQRKTAVSPLLPQSCTTAKVAPAAKGSDAPRAVANGKEKAQSLIANLLAEATREVAVRRETAARAQAADPTSYHQVVDEDEEGERIMTPGERVTAAAEAAAKAAAVKSRQPVAYVSDPAAKAAEVFGGPKVELPDESLMPAFELPAVAAAAKERGATTKEQVREEQRLKAKEAEERKAKKARDAEEKRVKAAEKVKAAEAEAKAMAEKAKMIAEKKAAQEREKAEAKAAAKAAAKAEAKAAAAAAAAAASGASGSRGVAPASTVKNIYSKTTTVAAAKRPASKGSVNKIVKLLKKHAEQNPNEMMAAAAVALIVFILMMASLM